MKKIFALLTALLFCGTVFAQTGVQIDNLGDGLSYREISSRLSSVEKLTKAETPDIDAMVAQVSYLNEMSIKLTAARQGINDEIKLIEKRIEALGDVDEKLPEARIIVQKRQEFRRELGDEKTRLSEIDILSAKIDELNLRIFDLRNQQLWGNLLNAEWAFINPAVFFQANQELFDLGVDIAKSPFLWYSHLSEDQRNIVKDNAIAVIIFIALISFLGYLLRRFVIRRWGYRADIEAPRLGRKFVAAFAVWCAYGIIPTAIIGFCLYWVVSAGMMSNSFLGVVLPSVLYYLSLIHI